MRNLTVCLCLSLCACSTTGAAQNAPYVLQPGHVNMEIGPDGNTVIFDAPDGLVVIDSGRHAAHSQAILDHAESVGKPVAALVNTHWHLDHTTGNRDILGRFPQAHLVATGAMEAALAGFLARSRTAAVERLAEPALPADARARTQRTLAALDDRAAMVPANPVLADGPLELGGRTFIVHVAPAAATEADLWLIAPDEGLAVVGDLVVAQVPFFDTGCEDGWRRALDAIAAEQWTTLVPGHGEPMTRADFTRWRSAFDSWLDCAAGKAEASGCAEGWMANAAGFYAEDESENVRYLAEAYVAEVLRASADQRMAYCVTAAAADPA